MTRCPLRILTLRPQKLSTFPLEPHVRLACQETDHQRADERWEFEDQAWEELDKLADVAPDAYDFLMARIELWAQKGARGVPEEDLKAPVARNLQAKVRQPPWLGEIRASDPQEKGSKRKDRLFRLYFGDISSLDGEPAHRMLIGLTSEKKIYRSSKKTNGAQNQQMQHAMYVIKSWCSSEGREYRQRK